MGFAPYSCHMADKRTARSFTEQGICGILGDVGVLASYPYLGFALILLACAGIGLAVCRKIATRHGGFITARSKPGEGATFLVLLPLTQQTDNGGSS